MRNEAQRVTKALAHEVMSERTRLQKAHARLFALRPVYSVDEWQPTSKTLRKRRGSCSQQMASLVAVARTRDIPTRVRAIYVEGSFWYRDFDSCVLLFRSAFAGVAAIFAGGNLVRFR